MRRSAASTLGLLVVAAGVLLGAPGATAAPAPALTSQTATLTALTATVETTNVIRARVRDDAGNDVAGVTISVEQEGAEVATGTTDDSGSVELAVPAAGAYDVVLDTDALPEASAGLEPLKDTIATTVEEGQPRAVAFRLQPVGTDAAGSGGPGFDQIAQLIVNGLRFGLIVAMAAIGVSLIFGTTGLTNFAHGELVTFGAVAAFFFNVTLGLPFLLAAVLALVVSAGFGWLNERALWGPLRRKGTGLIAMMIVSIGLGFLVRYLFLFFFGGSTRNYDQYTAQAGLILGPVRLRPVDLISMSLSIVVLVVVGFALLRTKLGKATRAVSDNPALAAASGIDVDRVVTTVWVTGTTLAALAGIFLGLSQGLNWQMGFQILLLVFAAVTLGGLGTAFGALLGSIIVGVFIEVSTLVVPTELKNVGALAILILILLVRPQGILGRAQRVG